MTDWKRVAHALHKRLNVERMKLAAEIAGSGRLMAFLVEEKKLRVKLELSLIQLRLEFDSKSKADENGKFAGSISSLDLVPRDNTKSSNPRSLGSSLLPGLFDEATRPLSSEGGVGETLLTVSRRKKSQKIPKISVDWDEQTRIWNVEVAPLLGAPLVRWLSAPRKNWLRLRLVERPTLWDEIRAQAKIFSGYHKEKRWISFDWLIRWPNNLQKFLEGNYREQQRDVSSVMDQIKRAEEAERALDR